MHHASCPMRHASYSMRNARCLVCDADCFRLHVLMRTACFPMLFEGMSGCNDMCSRSGRAAPQLSTPTASCPLRYTYCRMPTAHCLLLHAHCSLPPLRCGLLAFPCSLRACPDKTKYVHEMVAPRRNSLHLLPHAHRLMPTGTASRSLPNARCLLSDADCLLFHADCSLFRAL